MNQLDISQVAKIMTPQQKAATGLTHIKEAILEYLSEHPNGVRHSEIVKDLGLESAYEGKQKNYLSWSALGLLIEESKVRYEGQRRAKVYFRARVRR